ncbi:MAG TPA: glycosyltransferase family 39 protein [Phycisphaerae bacterium]|nr:glycosyltransferase family 39 protein [Phycisphaerae bacterium]
MPQSCPRLGAGLACNTFGRLVELQVMQSPVPSRDGSPALVRPWVPWVVLAAMVVVFCGLAWCSVQHVNTLWDELNDHRVAVALLDQPLRGSDIDATQARLPMYVTAGAYALTGPSIRVARAVSIAMGAVAIVLTFVAGRRWFGTVAGLLAAGLLSIAPHFLTFARTALTEGDAFYPVAVLLALLAFDHYLRRRDSVRLGLFAVALGVALATKFYAIFLVPAFVLCDLLDVRRRAEAPAGQPPISVIDARRADGRVMRIWVFTALGLEGAAAVAAQIGFSRVAAILWAAGLLTLIGGALPVASPAMRSAAAHLWKDSTAPSPADRYGLRGRARWSVVDGWLVALPLAVAVCWAICPAHVLNPETARALVRSLVRPVPPEDMVRLIDPARLYLGIILLKLGPLLGVLTLVALVWACVQRSHAGLTLLGTTCMVYLLLLLLLPIRQSFYLMGIYPLLALLLAALVVHVTGRLRGRERLASAWLALVATACLYLMWGMIWSYPEFGYYGYTLVGNTWLGAESRGYRNLIQVTNDGTEDALRWLAEHVPPGRRVISYLWDDHVIDAFLEHTPVPFHLVRRDAFHLRGSPPRIDDADFVVVGLNNKVSYHDEPPREQLEQLFDRPARHVVRRGRGRSEMQVVQIFSRKAPAMPASEPERP